MTPDQMRQLAREADAAALEAARAGDVPRTKALSEFANTLNQAADLMQATGRTDSGETMAQGRAVMGLQHASHSGKRKRMVAPQRLRVSEGRAGEEPDALVAAAQDAGLTLRHLAEKLRAEGWRVSHPFLRQCRLGTSRIRKPLADRIEALIGFRATRQNWPADGWAKEPGEGE